ncbi:hypothetical protein C0J08_12150 [Marinomonas sp. CT5]|uniref:energy transducer TonB n=1 Tax=Marinomonas sp. CT5 TaxID=2066133 RepID=UPI001BB07E81|nr:energy transducer TonB [Marinomonas sp. CT5]QUX96112.1 hypothetical protein C0J08_12150 [Marinomonas sp. CT5]
MRYIILFTLFIMISGCVHNAQPNKIDTSKIEAQIAKDYERLNKNRKSTKPHPYSLIRNKPCFTVQECANYLYKSISYNWHSPSPEYAYKGMQASVKIEIKHTGELVNVEFTKSSGNELYDKSALNAIKRAAPFLGIQALDSEVFEKEFSFFYMDFNLGASSLEPDKKQPRTS